MASVTLRNLTKTFKAVVAVNDLSLEIYDKEFLVLVGPSGCGKTTALRMIAGLEETTSGSILIGEHDVTDVAPKDRDIAMVFQNYALYPHMSVYENMAFALRMRKFPKDKIDARVQESAQLLGLENLLDRKPKQLSGGQRQRVALGRAIVREPQVFLMDEPLSNLDAKLRVQTRAEITKLQRRLGITTIYVTHDQVEAMTMGDRIVVMKDGLLQQCDTPMNIYRYPANIFVAGFIGTPPMNFMEGTLEKSGSNMVLNAGGSSLVLPTDRWPALSNYVGKKLQFGVRPEDIELAPAGSPNTISMNVDVVEPMGSNLTVYFTAKAVTNTLVANLSTDAIVKVGDTTSVCFDLTKCHLFDTETTKALEVVLSQRTHSEG